MEQKQARPATVDEYIAQFPPDVQEILARIRAIIKEAAPQAQEKISYQMPYYALNGRLVYFAAFKRHIGFYPMVTGITAFQGELSAYKGAKGSVQFPLDRPMPYDLIRKIIEFRVAENSRKSRRAQEGR